MKGSVVVALAGLAVGASAHARGAHVEMLEKRMEVIIREQRNMNNNNKQKLEQRQLGVGIGRQTTTSASAAAATTSPAVAVTTPSTAAGLLTTPVATTTTTPAAATTTPAQVIVTTTAAATTTTQAAVIVVTPSSTADPESALTPTSSVVIVTSTDASSDSLSPTDVATETSTSVAESSTAAATTKQNDSSSGGGLSKGVLIPLIVAASCAAAVAAIWTIIRKTKFSPSKRFEARMAPIDFNNDKQNGDPYGLRAHGRSASQKSYGSGGKRQHYAGFADELKRANSTSNASLSDVPLVGVPYQGSAPPARVHHVDNAIPPYAFDSSYAVASSGSYHDLQRSNTQRSDFYNPQGQHFAGGGGGYVGDLHYSPSTRRY